MRVINSIPWSSTEIESYRQIIWTNLIDGMIRVREVMDELNLETSEDTLVRSGGGHAGMPHLFTTGPSCRDDVQLTGGLCARSTGALRSSRSPIRLGGPAAVSTSVPTRSPNTVGRLCGAEGAGCSFGPTLIVAYPSRHRPSQRARNSLSQTSTSPLSQY